MTQEEAVYLVRSGLLEGRAIEVLDWARTNIGTFRGCIMFQKLMEIEADILSNPAATYPFGLEDIRQAIASMSRFTNDYTQMAMVTRKPMDAPRVDTLAHELITFYKSYPSLFLAQQLLRRGSIAAPVKYGIHLMLNVVMDSLYGVVLALARGAWELDELLEKAQERQVNWAEATKLLLRHPVFQSNALGLFANTVYKAVEPGTLTSNMYSSVQESALVQAGTDFYKVGEAFANPEFTWTQAMHQAYLKFGATLPGELGSAPIRILSMMAHDPGLATRTSKGGRPDQEKTAIGEAHKFFNSTGYEGQWRQWVRELTPAFRPPSMTPQRQEHKKLLKDLIDQRVNQIPKIPQPTKEPKPKAQVPTIPVTPVKTQGVQNQATTPEAAPSGLLGEST